MTVKEAIEALQHYPADAKVASLIVTLIGNPEESLKRNNAQRGFALQGSDFRPY